MAGIRRQHISHIAATAPGIFTADGSGSGEAAALNNSSSGTITLNSAANPAPIGATVTLYLTGEGDYNPATFLAATNTGYIIPASINPLPELSPLPTVTIGGVDASAGGSLRGRGAGIHPRDSADQRRGSDRRATGAAVPVL